MILDEIMAHKRQELEERRRAVPLVELRARGTDQPLPLDFAAALREEGVRLIAEVKRASPSKGVLCEDFDLERLAVTYAVNGAAAISVLTDAKFFQGELQHLSRAKSAIRNSQIEIPFLRKDFIFDPYQVYEARAYGADAVLLIVAALSLGELDVLYRLIRELRMDALVEVHNEAELRKAMMISPRIIGVNNRDLRTLQVDLETTARLCSLVPEHVILVSESGIHTAEDVRRLADMGADAVLVGEALVTASDTAAKARELTMTEYPGGTR